MINIGTNVRNSVCKDDMINEWNVKLNEIQDNASVIREMIDMREGNKKVIHFSSDGLSYIIESLCTD